MRMLTRDSRARRTGAVSGLAGKLIGLAAAIVAVIAALIVLSAVHLLPQLRNPFAENLSLIHI